MIFVNILYKVLHFDPWGTRMVVIAWTCVTIIIFIASAICVSIIQILPNGKKIVA